MPEKEKTKAEKIDPSEQCEQVSLRTPASVKDADANFIRRIGNAMLNAEGYDYGR